MPTKIDQGVVSSISSVIGSIDNDRQVYRWFLMFISLSAIQEKLHTQDKTRENYKTLRTVQITEIMTYMVIALVITASYLIKLPWLLLLGGIPLIILVNLFRKNRRLVAMISEQFLLENIRPQELSGQTLYQTCEYLSREYNIPSLVDIITYQDFIARKVLLATILFLPFLCAFKTWQIWGVTLTIFLATLAIVNTSIVLRRIK